MFELLTRMPAVAVAAIPLKLTHNADPSRFDNERCDPICVAVCVAMGLGRTGHSGLRGWIFRAARRPRPLGTRAIRA
jgi:hypothetical protein